MAKGENKKSLIPVITMVIGFFSLFIKNCRAEIIYADNLLLSDCLAGNYSIASRNCTGTDGTAYIKIQDSIDNMAIGDTIYVRGGTYRETNSSPDLDILIPASKNGDSWETGHFNTLASFPGEWAIIDGEGTAPKGTVIGLKGMTYCPTCVLRYWKFERLEITGGTITGNEEGGAGMFLPEGPFIIRYCYIHDNWDDSQLNNPAGIESYRLQNSVIEYNNFYRNGCAAGGNCRQIAIFNDYCDETTQTQCQNPPFTGTVNDIERATRNNIIRYNIFDGGPEQATIGLGYKSTQLLDPNDGSSFEHENLGDKIHHNIFLNHSDKAAKVSQDYLQFYKNIVDGSTVSSGEYNSNDRLRITIYNNSIFSGNISSWSRGSASGPDDPFIPWDYLYNNIIDNSPSNDNEHRAINFWAYVDNEPERPSHCTDIDTSHFDISHNYIYRPQNSLHFYMSGETECGSQFGSLSLSSFNASYSMVNFFKLTSEGSDNLSLGPSEPEKFITRAEHLVSDPLTVADSGIASAHPYLNGVLLPAYIGATKPGDSDWVEGVLGLADVNTLQSGSSVDPSWIEVESQTDLIPPIAPDGLNVQ